jgi:hypothetical protein
MKNTSRSCDKKFVISSETALRMTAFVCRPEQSPGDVLSASEGPGSDCHSEQSDESGFVFERLSPQILQAFGLQNDTLHPPQILRAVNNPQDDRAPMQGQILLRCPQVDRPLYRQGRTALPYRFL